MPAPVKRPVSKPKAAPKKPVAKKPAAKPPVPTKKPTTSTSTTSAKSTSETGKPKANDKVELSKEAGDPKEAEKAKEENAYEGIADKTSTVTVDPYKKGKNDTVEGMLRNQGYSLQDIYNKDKNGKTLIDHVASVNNLKNPNVIQDGAKLKIPGRDNSESMSSMDLKDGEHQKTKVENKDVGVSTESKMEKAKDGSTQLDVKTNNKENPDAALSTNTKVEKGGRIDTNSTGTKEGVKTNTVAQNNDGSAVTQVTENATKEKTDVTIKDIDRRGDNLNVTATPDNVNVVNPGSEKGGDVTNNVDISEKSSDGTVENAARWVAEKFGYGPEPQEPVKVNGAGQVDITKNDEGQATVNVDNKKVLETAGDTDDTWLERRGENVDDAISAVGDTVSSAWNAISDWWNGNDNSIKTEKSPVYKKTQRGRRRAH